MKKEDYDHLVNTFFDKNINNKKVKKINKKKYLVVGCIVLAIVFYFFTSLIGKRTFFSRSLSIVQDKLPVEIDYDFTQPGSSKIRILSFNLEGIDLSDYNFVKLVIRTNLRARIDSAIKVQIENSLLEKDAEYVSGINSVWSKFSLPLADFELISDWGSVKTISFVVEEWNVFNKRDKIFVDEIIFLE